MTVPSSTATAYELEVATGSGAGEHKPVSFSSRVGEIEREIEKTPTSGSNLTESYHKTPKGKLIGGAKSVDALRAHKNVDRALFNAYLRRSVSILEAVVAQNDVQTNLTQVIQTSEAYTVSVRTEKVYRLFISAMLLITRNNYDALGSTLTAKQMLGALKRFGASARDMSSYDAFTRSCYMAGLSPLNRK